MQRAIIAAISVGLTFAQSVTLPERLPEAVKDLGPGAGRGELPCTVDVLEPELNFASRFQAGYVVRAPMKAYPGKGHRWYVVFSVTAREGGGQPVLFSDSIDLPGDASSDAIGEVHGLFLLGEGGYHVKWSMLDDLGRMHRKEWDLAAKARGKERITMPSGTPGDLAWRSGDEAAGNGHPQRITLMVNIARTGGYPWTKLLAALDPVVERLSLAGDSVRLVVFDLLQQRELFREDGFTLHGMNRLVHETNFLTQGRVNRGALGHSAGVWSLLANLVNGEIHSPEPADAVVFVGAPLWIREAMPSGFPKPRNGTPRFFSVHYFNINASRIPRGGAGGWQGDMGVREGPPQAIAEGQIAATSRDQGAPFDTIKQTVLRMKGKIFVVQTPAAFSKAIGEIDGRGK